MTIKNVGIYVQETLPEGFRYPESFLEMVSADGRKNLYPWVLIDPKSEVGQLLFSLGAAEGKNLIPFASLENGDGDAACFDGNDTTGNPAVLMLILDESDRSYSFADFDDWMKMAEADALRQQSR